MNVDDVPVSIKIVDTSSTFLDEIMSPMNRCRVPVDSGILFHMETKQCSHF